jgi:hypothetical protein
MGTGLGLGIGIPFRRMGAGIDAQAQAHYNRVIADGGLIPSGLVGVNNFFTTVKGIYGTSDITTAISVGLDAQVLGYKLGAGAGTTAGQAAQKLYSCSGSSGDVVQTTAASQPLLLVHSGANYWWGSSVSSNYLSTPDAAANNFTGDIEIVVCAKAINWSSAYQVFAAKADNTGSGMFFFSTGGTNVLFYSTIVGGSLRQVASSASIPFANGTTGWLKLTHNTSNGDVIFYTSTDGITFTQLGTTQNVTSGVRNSNTKVVTIGSEETGTSRLFGGSIYKLTISNTIGGAPVVDFNPSQYSAATSQTQWTSSTGEVWTINTGTASTGYKGALITKTIVMSDGVDDKLSNTLQMPQYLTEFHAVNQLNFGSNDFISLSGSSLNHLLYNNGTTLRAYNLGNAVDFTSTANLLQIYTSDYAVSAEVRTNNSSINTGVLTGVAPSNGKTFFNEGGNYANCILSSYIAASTNLNNTQKTSMYDALKTINGL